MTLRCSAILGGLCVAVVCDLSAAGDDIKSKIQFGRGDPEVGCTVNAAPIAEPKLDPLVFFEQLVERYRKLNDYRDTARIVQVTEREGAEASRIESKIGCEIAGGKLRVETPASQARDALGLNLPIKQTQAMKDADHAYCLWIAPHMGLKFCDQPLKEFRAGIDEGFTATEAESVTIDDKKMVHLELRSGDGLSADCEAKFDLYVNSDSMLIERIEGAQRLPDGATHSTILHITPLEAPSAEPKSEPAA